MKDCAARVYEVVAGIPPGRVSTYGEVARALGDRNLARAVGSALRKNTDYKRVPCHRVVGSDGSLGGFNRGTVKKAALLESEGVRIRDNRVVDFGKVFHRFK